MQFLDQIPWNIVIIAALTLGLAPFFPEPHIWEKLKMLVAGTLSRPVDIFDLLMHGAPWLLLIAKGLREVLRGQGA
ncbi:RND transporter [Loktanella sp. IMCC34160]|uniref:RND transporter n=1 Tax=Rhodobacterales TaxID=204455 RepID=UPI00101DAF32|nr:RND transporter [Loktanella sp. IMCC34160]RYG92018.1 RND transporter [Loktanella sp. IMCC34160]